MARRSTADAVAASTSNAIKRVSILAIDTSDSMAGARIAEAKKAATTYLDAVPDNVYVGMVTFDDTVKLLVKPSLDRKAAQQAIDGLTLTHNTALYDGVLGAIDATGPGGADAGQRRVLVLSDGQDTTSTELSKVVDEISRRAVARRRRVAAAERLRQSSRCADRHGRQGQGARRERAGRPVGRVRRTRPTSSRTRSW